MFYSVIFLLVGLGFLVFTAAGAYFLFRKVFKSLSMKGNSEEKLQSLGGIDFNSSLTARSVVVAAIAILMLIPLAMIDGVVSERNGLYQGVLNEIAATWGDTQTLAGPIMVVPFVEKHRVDEKVKEPGGATRTFTSQKFINKYSIVLPKELDVDVSIEEEQRKRGIYKSLVYKANAEISGYFAAPDISQWSNHLHKVEWDKAYVILGLSDTKAINKLDQLLWNDTSINFAPGTQLPELIGKGFHAKLSNMEPEENGYKFSASMSFSGSKGIRFSPTGQETTVSLVSTWPHPSFQGSFLPASREITDTGFKADWIISHLARDYPQSWIGPDKRYSIEESTAGVDLFEPVFLYSKLTRAVKYGILFIGLTLLTFLIFELTAKIRIHYVQYGLIGIAMALFYLVLLSVAEHISFLKSYFIAALITIGLITAYTAAVLRDVAKSVLIFVLLVSLYAVLYSLLQLEDFALLMGTSLLVLVTAVLMYVTRNLRTDRLSTSAEQL